MIYEEKPAIPFNLQGVDGKIYTLDNFVGKWLLMVFHRHLG